MRLLFVTSVISNFTHKVIQKFRAKVIYLLYCKLEFIKESMGINNFKIDQIQNQLINLMNLVNDQLSRKEFQINIYKILISFIVFLAIIFLITDEGFFFGIN